MDAPADITIPEPGSTTARRVLGAYLKRTLTDFLRLPRARFDSRVADDFVAVRSLVERLAASGDAGSVFAIVRRPAVSTLVRCLDAQLWGEGDVVKLDAWLTELNATIALELAVAGVVPDEGLELRRAPPRLVSPGQAFAVSLPPGARLVFSPGQLAVHDATGDHRLDLRSPAPSAALAAAGIVVEAPYHTISGGLLLATVDSNPLSSVEAHPEKAGNAVDLGGRSGTEWVRALADALDLVGTYLPELAAEIRLVMQLVVPVGYDDHRHLSASYAEAIGIAYLSLHPDGMTMAEALIHEFSHNKLNALQRLDPLLVNAFHPLFSSPVRPDPRPLYGVLLAVHAFTPVARLYERMIAAGDPRAKTPPFERRYRQIAHGNHAAVTTLVEHGQPTAVGRGVLDELRRWDEHFAPARREAAVGPTDLPE